MLHAYRHRCTRTHTLNLPKSSSNLSSSREQSSSRGLSRSQSTPFTCRDFVCTSLLIKYKGEIYLCNDCIVSQSFAIKKRDTTLEVISLFFSHLFSFPHPPLSLSLPSPNGGSNLEGCGSPWLPFHLFPIWQGHFDRARFFSCYHSIRFSLQSVKHLDTRLNVGWRWVQLYIRWRYGKTVKKL